MSAVRPLFSSARARGSALGGDESGFTLIEMIVASVLGVLVLGIGASLLLSLFRTQHSVSDYADATTTGQLVSRAIEQGVRNAAALPNAANPGDKGILAGPMVTGTGQLLRARVAIGTQNGDVTWQCQAWYYSDATHTVLWARSTASAIADPGGFAWNAAGTGVVPLTPQAGVNWTLLGTGITIPADGLSTQFFGAQAGLDVDSVTLRFQVTHGSIALVLIRNTIVQRKLDPTGSGPAACY